MSIKKLAVPLMAFALGVVVNFGLISKPQSPSVQSAEEKPLYWVAPMDANFRRDEPGLSPMGMDLVPVYKDNNNAEPGTVSISPNIENSLGVKIASVQRKDMHRNIQSAGFLQYDESSIQHYHVRVNGWLEKLYVDSVGDKVKKGQKLFDLYSPELVYAQEEYLAAINTKNNHLIESALLKLNALGVSGKQIQTLEKHKKVRQILSFYAARSGYISKLNVRQGMYIQPQLEIMATGDLSSIWVTAEVFERQASWLEINSPVEMTLAAFPEKKWLGKIDYIFPTLNNENRTVQARIVFNNADLLLKPNMFAELNIQASSLKGAIVVPSESVIYSSDMQRVVLALGDGQFRSTRVIAGVESMGFTQILTGLKDGQHVVKSAQFLIDSESSIHADLSRMQSEVKDNNDVTDSDRVWVLGSVTNLQKGHSLEIQHQPIEEWQWPAMKMSLNVQQDVSIKGLKQGDSIGFCLDKMPDGQYLVTHIEKQNKDSKNSDSSMSTHEMEKDEMIMEMSHD